MGRRPLPKWITPLDIRPLTPITIWGISSPFEPLSPSSGQVTNALLTHSPLRHVLLHTSVRLACIRHAASVYPEPGSNSPHKIFTSFDVDVSQKVCQTLKKDCADFLSLFSCQGSANRAGRILSLPFWPVKASERLNCRCLTCLHRHVRPAMVLAQSLRRASLFTCYGSAVSSETSVSRCLSIIRVSVFLSRLF